MSKDEILNQATEDASGVKPGKTNAVTGCCDQKIDLQIGLFFDGTGNNKDVDEKETDKDQTWAKERQTVEENQTKAEIEAKRKELAEAEQAKIKAEQKALKARQEALVLRGQAERTKAEIFALTEQSERTIYTMRTMNVESKEFQAASEEIKRLERQRQEAWDRWRQLSEQASKKEEEAKAAEAEIEQANKKIIRLKSELKNAEARLYRSSPGTSNITNVVKLLDLYPEVDKKKFKYRHYLRGVGTFSGSESGFFIDEKTGQGLGVGGEGGDERINEASKYIKDILSIELPKSSGKPCPPDSVTIDIFGFSRGAALARHFVNVILDGLPDYSKDTRERGHRLVKIPGQKEGNNYKEYTEAKILGSMRVEGLDQVYEKLPNVTIRFVGIFDTVGSFYLGGNSDEGDFQLSLPTGCAKKIFHIVAKHERRKNFRYTSIKPGDGEEIFLSGAHSDIGGGYQLYEVKKLLMDKERYYGLSYTNAESTLRYKALQRGILKNPIDPLPSGWFFENIPISKNADDLCLMRYKRTDNRYSHVALHIMHKKALAAAVPLKDLDDTSPLHQVPADVSSFIDTPDAPMSLELWEKYIHVSAVDNDPELLYAKMPRGRLDSDIGMWLDDHHPSCRGGFENKENGELKREGTTKIKEYGSVY